MHEWPILLLRVAAQGRFDDAVRRTDDRGQLGAGVDVQLLIDVHEVRGHCPFADAEPFGDLTVGKTMDDVTDDLALAMAELLIEDGFHLSVRDEVGNPGPVRLVLAPHERAELVRPILLEQIHIVKLPRMLHGHRHEAVFVVGGEDLPAGRTGESQPNSLDLFWHAGDPLLVSVVRNRSRQRLRSTQYVCSSRSESTSSSANRFWPSRALWPWTEVYRNAILAQA